MSDYTIGIQDLSSNARDKIKKDISVYLDSYEKKQSLKSFYDLYSERALTDNNLPFSYDDLYSSFRAKNFWKDLNDCGSWLEFRWYKRSDKTKLHSANFCKRDKLCVACAVRRAYKQQTKFLQIIEEDSKLLDRDWYYIVLPVKHDKTEPLEVVLDRVADLRKKISTFMRDSRKGKHRSFWSNFEGGMFAQEVTKTKNGWNVHLNLLLNAPRLVEDGAILSPDRTRSGGIKLKEVRNRNGQISHQNEELRQFMIKHFDSQMHDIQKLDFSDQESLRGALVEILKYALKFSSLSYRDLIEVFIKTKKKRLFGTFGNLWGKGIETVDLDKDDIVPGDDFIELIFTRSFIIDGMPTDYPVYNLYKREEKQVENPELKELVHTFGVVVPKIAEHKSYYNKSPLILLSKSDNGRFHIKSNGVRYG
jgi:hypothetical protein